MASRGVGEIAGGPADTGSDIEHATRRPKAERHSRRTNGVGAVVVPLIDGKKLLRPDGVSRSDAEGGQCLLDAIEVRIERHRADRCGITHAAAPSRVLHIL
jgi:hypothetical protein